MMRKYLTSGKREESEWEATPQSSPPPKKATPVDKAVLIEAHWHHLGPECQRAIVEESFGHLFVAYPHMRPLWAFGRTKFVSLDVLRADPSFDGHVSRVVDFVGKLVENLQEPKWFNHFLEETALRHFFYDAAEPHFCLAHESLLAAFKAKCPSSGAGALTGELEKAWDQLLGTIADKMAEGCRESRRRYLRLTIVPEEMKAIAKAWQKSLKKSWVKVREFGLEEAGAQLCQGALRAYQSLLSHYGQEAVGRISLGGAELEEEMRAFASDTIAALDLAVDSYDYSRKQGFKQLPDLLQDYVAGYVVEGLSPVVVRKAAVEGFLNALTYVLGDLAMTPEAQRTWLKLYRVIEQAVIANLVAL